MTISAVTTHDYGADIALPDLMLIIAGDITDYTEELRQLSKNLNLDGKIKFIGRIDEFKKSLFDDTLQVFNNTVKKGGLWYYSSPRKLCGKR